MTVKMFSHEDHYKKLQETFTKLNIKLVCLFASDRLRYRRKPFLFCRTGMRYPLRLGIMSVCYFLLLFMFIHIFILTFFIYQTTLLAVEECLSLLIYHSPFLSLESHFYFFISSN